MTSASTFCKGLSPRVRGNRPVRKRSAQRWGSIPARAGKPFRHSATTARLRVYPRACGETARSLYPPKPSDGLSPRVRGNLAASLLFSARSRSIPARAGKPCGRTPRRTPAKVYPRACGETHLLRISAATHSGLSPRVRGNRGAGVASGGLLRSIPARAGKPSPQPTSRCTARVYPRACGETISSHSSDCSWSGLSPRVRGNPMAAAVLQDQGGSIPARAGKPLLKVSSPVVQGVYPRACGETSSAVLSCRVS